jgi:hypothetical protein
MGRRTPGRKRISLDEHRLCDAAQADHSRKERAQYSWEPIPVPTHKLKLLSSTEPNDQVSGRTYYTDQEHHIFLRVTVHDRSKSWFVKLWHVGEVRTTNSKLAIQLFTEQCIVKKSSDSNQ